MRWKPDLNLTTNARVFTGVYLGALMMVPPGVPFGLHNYTGMLPVVTALTMPLLGGFIAGLIAGKGHGVRTGVLAYLMSRSAYMAAALFHAGIYNYLAEWILLGLFLIGVPAAVIGLVAWCGERLAARLCPHDRVRRGWVWRLAGLAFLLIYVYTLTLGAQLAVALHDPYGYRGWTAFPAGVYVGLHRQGVYGSYSGGVVYADPSGMFIIGESAGIRTSRALELSGPRASRVVCSARREP